MFHLLRRRIAPSLAVGAGGTMMFCAYTTEYHARQLEAKYYQHEHDSSSHTPTLPREYDWEALRAYWAVRPVSTMRRFAHVFYELSPVAGFYVRHFVLQRPKDAATADAHFVDLSERLREALTNLGPAFVKMGQQLSIRPDLVPPAMLKELQKLCDAVRPIPDEVALRVIQEELGELELDTVFEEMRMVASASLGQVYKAKLRKTGEFVAIKVQRPDIRQSFTLDLFLLKHLGYLVDVFTSTFTSQPPFHSALYDSFARGSYSELDYEKEAASQILFKRELGKRKCPVVVPRVYEELTTERVLTSEWIDGVKLADSPEEVIRKLIPVGVELFLTQLLDMGLFHADPQPGNLLVTSQGKLCLLDFGLTTEVDVSCRDAMTRAIVHLLLRDFDSLVSHDAKEMGFLPKDYDTSELKPLLVKILTVGVLESSSDLRKRKRKLLEISNELNEIFFRYPFTVPPFFALVTRGLGLLEGIALTGDPDFDIFQASAPYARRRAVALLGSRFSKLIQVQ